MQVDTNTFSIVVAQPPVKGVSKLKGYAFKNKCAISLTSFDKLVEYRQQTAAHIPYLIAKVKDVAGGVHFYDAALVTTCLKKTFTNPCSNLACKNVKFYQILDGKTGRAIKIAYLSSNSDSTVLNFVSSFDPQQMQHRVNYALECLNKGQIDEGVHWAKICLHDSVDIVSLTTLAYNILHKAHNRETAQSLLEKALQLDPNNEVALVRLGVLLQENKEYDRAKELLDRAVANGIGFEELQLQADVALKAIEEHAPPTLLQRIGRIVINLLQ